jgi:hypothetical protein
VGETSSEDAAAGKEDERMRVSVVAAASSLRVLRCRDTVSP